MDNESSEDAWAAHEVFRRSFLDRTSALWEAAPRLCLMWLGSLPSGEANVVAIRDRLQNLRFGPGHFDEFMAGAAFIPPSVVHECNGYAPDSDTVWVGWGNCAATLSPWSCPFLPIAYSAAEARRVFHRRADVGEWLARLSGKTLVCNCSRCPNDCWANILQDEFNAIFEEAAADRKVFTFDIPDEDLDVQPEAAIEAYARVRDEVDVQYNSSPSVPTSVPWPEFWIELVKTIRALRGPTFWEVFAGMAAMTTSFRALGIECAPPIDVIYNTDFNVLNPGFLSVVIGILASHLIVLLHAGPPCSSFSAILNGFRETRVRSREFPEGIPGLTGAQAEKVRLGNALADVAAILVEIQSKAENLHQLEQPGRSLMISYGTMAKALKTTESEGFQRDACVDGAPWRKPLVLYTSSVSVGARLAAKCRGCTSHRPLRGRAPNGIDWTKLACPYWPAWADAVASKWYTTLVRHRRKSGWEGASPVLLTPEGATHGEALALSNFVPSGGRTLARASQTMATGLQPTRKALPQLIPDGLPPNLHLQAALVVKHPMTLMPRSTDPVDYALKYADDDFEAMRKRRLNVVCILRELAAICKTDNDELTARCEETVATMLQAMGIKSVAFMREIAFVCGSRDIASPSLLLIGLPMLGWAPAAEGLVARTRPPKISVEEFLEERDQRNEKLIAATKASGDNRLDEKAYSKTMAEAQRGVLRGPYESLMEVPYEKVAVVPRHGIWEQHGGAEEPSVRCIDDMLCGGQNDTVGTVSSHRPTDPDGLVAQTRAVRRRYPNERLEGWPCDLEKAYKQVPGDPAMIMWVIIVIWSIAHGKPQYFVPLCQLFGGKSPPLNFARYAAWLCECAASLFGLAVSHCVDDIIGIEPAGLAASGNLAFKILCSLTGWTISASKSPLPSGRFVVIGVLLDLTGTPMSEAILQITEKRLEQLTKILMLIEANRKLGSGEAASLTGKLGFSLCACFGRVGRAKLRPFIRRSGERRSAVNHQIQAAVTWWLKFLREYVPRHIPFRLEDLNLVVSYSDGEGARAGLGIAVWSARCPDGPLAAFCEIPVAIRNLWDRQAGLDEYNDIFLIEAIGPLAILETFPKIVKNSLWLHFIDNVAAQHSLIKGSSSIMSGDIVIGETWKRIQKLNAYAYFDRVMSESNPVDGLSRGRPCGPWKQVLRAKLPRGLLQMLEMEAAQTM